MKTAVKKSSVADRNGYHLSPIQPSLRLAEISERARIRALTVKLVRGDRLAIIAHQHAMAFLDRY